MRRHYWLMLLFAVAGGGGFEFLNAPAAVAGRGPTVLATAAPDAASLPAVPVETTAHIKVAQGDTLAELFETRNLSAADLAAIMNSGQGAERLKRIVPGDVIRVTYTPDAHIQNLHMQYDDAHMLDVVREGDGFSASVSDIPTTVSSAYAHGVIENSLFDSAGRAGLSDATTMELIELFAWDIDFAHDIQNGDSFNVLYEKVQRAGHAIVDGPILAAEFKTGDKDYRIVRYTDPTGQTGYYTPDGHSIKKALMRAPISYSRISSGFSLHRKHPILGFSRAHQGVDYAAPVGTPIKAAGDGRVTFVGVKGGYGKCITIDHGGGYSTLYGHLSHFKVGMHMGKHVTQEQIIGFVGMTGLATGPHLHFEVRVNGVPRNPRTVQLPNVEPVTTQYLADFDQSAKGLLAQLSSVSDTRLAGNANTAAAGTETAAH
ncbi:MAG TPA: peptidoglycan DD-metalloendopeptidase family protein [Gammaproteobacteria bacterium]|nr:peptidoglycan DD-metalloendopeptidase family protein [Gammaproteobacteria bacterium]